jgi:hypothetical protein
MDCHAATLLAMTRTGDETEAVSRKSEIIHRFLKAVLKIGQ